MTALDSWTVIHQAGFNNPSRWRGPIVQDSNGNLYAVSQDSAVGLAMMKSADNGDTWAEVDSAGAPSISNGNIQGVSWWGPVGSGSNTVIRIAYISTNYPSGMDNVRDLFYTQFTCSDGLVVQDEWSATVSTVHSAFLDGVAGGTSYIQLYKRSGDNVIIYGGPSRASMGSEYQTSYVAYGSGASWTTTRIDAKSDASHSTPYGIGQSSQADEAHLFYDDEGRTLRTDDSLSTAVAIHNASVGYNHGPMVRTGVTQNSGAETGIVMLRFASGAWRLQWVEEDASDDVQVYTSTTNYAVDIFGTLPADGEAIQDPGALVHDPINNKMWALWAEDTPTPNAIQGISAPDDDTYTAASWDSSKTALVSDADVPTVNAWMHLDVGVWAVGGTTYMGIIVADHNSTDTAYFFRYVLATSAPSGDGVINQASTVVATGTKDVGGAASISQAQTVASTGTKKAHNDAAITQGHTITATGTARETHSGDASISQGHTVAATGTKNAQSDPAISQPSTVASTGTKQASADPTITQPSTVASGGTSARSGDSAINQASTVVATGSVGSDDRHGDAAISQPSTVVATGEKAASNDAAIAQGHTVVATGTKNAQADPSISQPSTVASTGTKAAHGDPSIAQASTVTATGSTAESRHGDAAISQGHTVVATGTKDASGDAAISQPSTVSGAGSKQAHGDGAISQPSTVAATGTVGGGSVHGNAAITQGHTVTATGTKNASASASITQPSTVGSSGIKGASGDPAISQLHNVGALISTQRSGDSTIIALVNLAATGQQLPFISTWPKVGGSVASATRAGSTGVVVGAGSAVSAGGAGSVSAATNKSGQVEA